MINPFNRILLTLCIRLYNKKEGSRVTAAVSPSVPQRRLASAIITDCQNMVEQRLAFSILGGLLNILASCRKRGRNTDKIFPRLKSDFTLVLCSEFCGQGNSGNYSREQAKVPGDEGA